MTESEIQARKVKNAQAGLYTAEVSTQALTDLAVGIARTDAIGATGKETVRRMEALGVAGMAYSKQSVDNMKIIDENLSEMLSAVDNQSRKAMASTVVMQAETNLGGSSKQEAQDIITQDAAKDAAVIKREAVNAKVQLAKNAIGMNKQRLEDLESMQSSLVTEKEVMAQGIVSGLNSLANVASSATSYYGAK